MDELSFANLGAKQSEPDYRDHKDAQLVQFGGVPSSYSTDLSVIDVTHQKKLGICTANLAYIIEWLYWKKTGVYTKLSRRFLYSVTKNLIDQNTEEGSSLRNALKAAYNYGVCTEATFPSDTEGFTHAEYIDINAIPSTAWAEARKFKLGGYVSIPTDRASMEAGIYKYGMLYSMMLLGKEWWTNAQGISSWNSVDIDPLRAPVQYVSGHATVDYGFDGTFHKKRNSWSTAWDLQGNATFNPDNYPTIEAWGCTLDRIVNDLPAVEDFKHAFLVPMERGQRGEEVRQLQIALMISGDLDYVQPIDRGYYGSLTQSAVLRYQLRKKIPLSWTERYIYAGRYCGKKTLAALTKDFN